MDDHTTISTFQLFKMFPDNEADALPLADTFENYDYCTLREDA